MARALLGFSALALTLLAGCARAPGQRPSDGRPGTPAPVVLRFGWPDGYRARVDLHHEGKRTGQPSTFALVRQQLATERRGNEIWIFTRDLEAQGDEPNLRLNLQVGETLVYVVTPEGEFLRPEGVEKAAGLLQGEEDGDPRQIRASLVRMAAEDWAVTVGVWRGQQFEEGKPRRRRTEESLPLLPGTAMELDVELSLVGHVPCVEGQQPRCVQLRYISSPATRQGLVEKLQAAVMPQDWVVEDAAARFEAQLVTDPDTLLPHRLVVHQYLRLQVRSPAGDTREIEDRTSDDYRFTQEVEI